MVLFKFRFSSTKKYLNVVWASKNKTPHNFITFEVLKEVCNNQYLNASEIFNIKNTINQM